MDYTTQQLYEHEMSCLLADEVIFVPREVMECRE